MNWKSGLIGFIVFTITAFFLIKTFYTALNLNFFISVILTGILGFLLGLMIGDVVKKERSKISFIPLIVLILHFIITLLLGFFISDDVLIILAPFIAAAQNLSKLEAVYSIFLHSIMYAFISFIIIKIIARRSK